MKLKRVEDFLNESVHTGKFTVTKDMVKDGLFISDKIPEIINGDFICNGLKLISLKGGPKEVNGDFYCVNNSLTDLYGCPKIVNNISLSFNALKSLKGTLLEVKKNITLSYNDLSSLEGNLKKVGRDVIVGYNPFNLKVEADFIASGSFKNDYYADLLDYMVSNNIDLSYIEVWPEGFLSRNIKRSAKGKKDFNL